VRQPACECESDGDPDCKSVRECYPDGVPLVDAVAVEPIEAKRYMLERHAREFDLRAIVARARDRGAGKPSSSRLTFALSALAIALPTMALGFSNRTALEARITAQLTAWNESYVRTTFLDAQRTVTLADAKEHATFHFVLPMGLPKDARLESIEEIDPSTYMVTYRRARADALYFSIWKREMGKHSATTAGYFVTRGDSIERSYRLRTYVWNVGDESVILSARAFPSQDLDGMDRAMGESAARTSARRVP
jgi:hypothetical protein